MSGIFVYENPEQAAPALGGRPYTPEGPDVAERISQISELSEESIDRALAKVSAPAEEPEAPASRELPPEPDEGERAAHEARVAERNRQARRIA